MRPRRATLGKGNPGSVSRVSVIRNSGNRGSVGPLPVRSGRVTGAAKRERQGRRSSPRTDRRRLVRGLPTLPLLRGRPSARSPRTVMTPVTGAAKRERQGRRSSPPTRRRPLPRPILTVLPGTSRSPRFHRRARGTRSRLRPWSRSQIWMMSRETAIHLRCRSGTRLRDPRRQTRQTRTPRLGKAFLLRVLARYRRLLPRRTLLLLLLRRLRMFRRVGLLGRRFRFLRRGRIRRLPLRGAATLLLPSRRVRFLRWGRGCLLRRAGIFRRLRMFRRVGLLGRRFRFLRRGRIRRLPLRTAATPPLPLRTAATPPLPLRRAASMCGKVPPLPCRPCRLRHRTLSRSGRPRRASRRSPCSRDVVPCPGPAGGGRSTRPQAAWSGPVSRRRNCAAVS